MNGWIRQQHPLVLGAWIIAIYTVVLGLYSMTIDAHPDMADHWIWSLQLQGGYLEHPPMVAWLIAGFDAIPGLSGFVAVKLAALVLWSAAVYMFFTSVLLGFDSAKVAFGYLALVLSSPYFFALGLLMTINVPMYFFTAAALLALMLFYRSNNAHWLLVVAVLLGLSGLAKLLVVFVCIAIYCWLIAARENRWLWLRWQVYALPLIVLMVMGPFWLWNIENDWLNIGYQLDRSASVVAEWNITKPAIFISSLLVYGVLALPLLLYFAAATFKRSQGVMILVQFLLWPVLAVCVYTTSRGGHMDVQWAGIGIIFSYVLLADALQRIPRWGVWLYGVNGMLGLVLVVFVFGHVSFHWGRALFDSPFADKSMAWVGWQQTARQIQQLRSCHGVDSSGELYIGNDYDLPAAIALYDDGMVTTYSLNKPQRNLWVSPTQITHTAIVAVCDAVHEDCPSFFSAAQRLVQRPLYQIGDVTTLHPYSKIAIRQISIASSMQPRQCHSRTTLRN